MVSGDYKTVDDGLSTPFEPVRCHTFISESTFGLPIYSWTPQDVLARELNTWWAETAASGRHAVLGVYALGKAQRILRLLDPSNGPILTHGAVEGHDGGSARAGPRPARDDPDHAGDGP